MNSILPVIYLLILFISLVTLLTFLVRQILKKKELETELSELQKKLRSGSATAKDYYSVGVIYLSKKFSKALKNWDKDDLEGLSNLYNTIGFTYFESEQFDVSIYYYKEAIALRPNYIVALNNLAYAYEKKRMLQDAVEVYSQVLTLDAENETANEKLITLKGRSKIRDDRI
jgi:tetratricopeptide (TPR) repeat protein